MPGGGGLIPGGGMPIGAPLPGGIPIGGPIGGLMPGGGPIMPKIQKKSLLYVRVLILSLITQGVEYWLRGSE